jgi:hypothetical protein
MSIKLIPFSELMWDNTQEDKEQKELKPGSIKR